MRKQSAVALCLNGSNLARLLVIPGQTGCTYQSGPLLPYKHNASAPESLVLAVDGEKQTIRKYSSLQAILLQSGTQFLTMMNGWIHF